MDWIAETERLVSISETSLREDLPYISLVFVYIGIKKEVVSVVKDTLVFDSSVVIISKEKRTELVLTHNKENFTHKDTCLFHIPIEPEVISRLHEDSYKNYWTSSFSHDKDIILPPSIFIFHPYNTLYFMYYEEKENEEDQKIKSALRHTNNSGIGKLTKRVRWGGVAGKRKTAHRK